MRLSDKETIHTLALYALPLLVALLNFGFFGAFVLTLLVAVAGIFIRMRSLIAPPDPSLIELHTITYSHYVEKVRWSLDRMGIAYREVPSIGILGILLTGRTVPVLSVPFSRLSIGDSPKILRYLWGEHSARLPRERIGFLEPTPEALALEKHFDEDLGVPLRCWSYWHALRDRELTLLWWGIDEPTIPQWQRKLLPIVYPLLSGMLKRMLNINEASAARGLVVSKQAFAEVEALLADGRRYLMGGDEMTFVDITFATLASLVIFPDGYGGRDAYMQQVPLERFSPEWRAEVEAFRASIAGQWVLELYARERQKS